MGSRQEFREKDLEPDMHSFSSTFLNKHEFLKNECDSVDDE